MSAPVNPVNLELTMAGMQWQRAWFSWYDYLGSTQLDANPTVDYHNPDPSMFEGKAKELAQEFLNARSKYLSACTFKSGE